MAAGEGNSIVSVPSSTPDPSTLPSSPNQAGIDRPSSSHVTQGIDAMIMADECEEAGSVLPPHRVDNNAGHTLPRCKA